MHIMCIQYLLARIVMRWVTAVTTTTVTPTTMMATKMRSSFMVSIMTGCFDLGCLMVGFHTGFRVFVNKSIPAILV